MKWKDIAARLGEKDPPVTITPAALRNFFIRSRSPKLKLPAGLEHLRPSQEPESAPKSFAAPAAQLEQSGDWIDQAIEASRPPKTELKIFKPRPGGEKL